MKAGLIASANKKRNHYLRKHRRKCTSYFSRGWKLKTVRTESAIAKKTLQNQRADNVEIADLMDFDSLGFMDCLCLLTSSERVH